MAASPAIAQVVEQGDIVSTTPKYNVDGSDPVGFVLIDAETGAETVISCWEPPGTVGSCSPAVGIGPVDRPFSDIPPYVSSDGWVYYTAQNTVTTGRKMLRANLLTGDRELIADEIGNSFAVVPALEPPPSVASLGTLGLAMLVVGIFIGVQLRFQDTSEA